MKNIRLFQIKIISWIIDVMPLTKLNLENAVEELKNQKRDVDLIVYIGNLDKTPSNLFKVSEKLLKRQSIFSGKILDETQVPETVFKMSNWNINLSNFDHK